MHFTALLDMRPMHWYVYVPALGCGAALTDREDAEATAAALITAATGLPPADLTITLRVARGAAMVVQEKHTEVDVRHRDGAWYTAEHLGWLRSGDGAWQALVSYSAEGVLWERAMPTSRFRHPDERFPADAGAPRNVALAASGDARPSVA